MKINTLSKLIVISVICAVALYAGILLWLVWPISELSLDRSGLFGDSFGLLTSLFSGLAFSGMLIAVLLQREELSLQRKELEQTRQELQGQKQEMKLQNKTLLKQSFENTFFQLLSLHQDIIDSIDLYNERTKVTTKGRDCFKAFFKRFKSSYEDYRGFLETEHSKIRKWHFDESDFLEVIDDAYMEFYQENQAEIGHYFRSLYNIVKFIDNCTDITKEEKKLYSNLLRAQLSANELVLLFYNSLSRIGVQKFKPLIERYSLLKGLPHNLLLKNEHFTLYEDSAFK